MPFNLEARRSIRRFGLKLLLLVCVAMLARGGRTGVLVALLSLGGLLSVVLALWRRDRADTAMLTRWDEAAAVAALGLLLHWMDYAVPNDLIATAWHP